MTWEQTEALLDEVLGFLQSCGGVYNDYNRLTETAILLCLVNGQYVIYRNEDGKIEHFNSFFRVTEQDIPTLENREIPERINRGTIIYMAECGNKAGREVMLKSMQDIKKLVSGATKVLLHHKGQPELREYRRQKGA